MTHSPIHKLGEERRHYWLAVGMADVSGADLQKALEEGRITHGDWAGLVERCRGCTWAEGCDCWLKTQEPGAAVVPRACPNADMFDQVLSQQTDR